MVHLLLDRSASVQKMAYSLLQKAANKRTEYLVIEAGIDTSSEAKYELPEELLQIVTTALEVGNDVQQVCRLCPLNHISLCPFSLPLPERLRFPPRVDDHL